MGGGDGMSEAAFVSAIAPGSILGTSEISQIPQGVLQALRVLNQEQGEDTERDALNGVVDSLVEWFLHETRSPKSADGGFGLQFLMCSLLSFKEYNGA